MCQVVATILFGLARAVVAAASGEWLPVAVNLLAIVGFFAAQALMVILLERLVPILVLAVPGLLVSRQHSGSGVITYICSGTQCQTPIDELQEFEQALAGTDASASMQYI